MIEPSTPRDQLAALVSETLRSEGHDVVLVGGSVVSIYTSELFVSDDLDFATYRAARELRPALERLGFTEFLGNTATHPRAKFYVQFVNAPVAIGAKVDVKPVELQTSVGVLRTLSTLDCVLDRLAAFIHYGDRQCLRQAIEVADRHDVSIESVKEWVDREPGDPKNRAERFAEFDERLKRRRSR